MIALETARKKQSSQTGFIHRDDLIPIYENLCFALSLFRTHVGEQVEEGKDLLKRLFGFFSEGFPLYLHEYPSCATPSHQIRCALPLHWILKLYQHVIEPSLKDQAKQIYAHLINQEEDALSPIYKVLLRALKGKEVPSYKPQFSHEWGLLLLAYQTLDEKPTWILEQAVSHWHPELMTYCGDPVQEYQRKTTPDVTLYDLFMAEHQKATSARLREFHPIHIQGALVFPFKEKKSLASPTPFKILRENENWGAKGFHLMRYLWGSADQVRSLVCQDNMTLETKGNQLLFTYSKEVPSEKERMELTLFTEYDPHVKLFVEEKKQTVFHLGETVEIQTPEKTLKLVFTLEKGEGLFMGHISRGNRRAQIAIEGPKDFSSYDWKIGLRSIHRSAETVIGLRVL